LFRKKIEKPLGFYCFNILAKKSIDVKASGARVDVLMQRRNDLTRNLEKAIVADRYAFFSEFFKNFYNTDLLLGKRVSEQTVQASWNVAAGASATACLACVATWHEDFRQDLTRVDVPTLVMQGDADRILPISASGLRTAKLILGARLVVVKDGPHCITWTHADDVNRELLSFLGEGAGKRAGTASGA